MPSLYDDIIAGLKSQIDEYTALTEEIHSQMGVIRAQNLPMHAPSMASIDGEAHKDARGDVGCEELPLPS